MTDEKSRRTPLINQILLILMGAMLVYLVVSFTRQVTTGHQRTAELNRVREKIHIAAARKAQLDQYSEYVLSPEAADKWARRHGLTKPNEVLVVAFGAGTKELPPEQQILEDGRKPDTPQGAWWDLFFKAR